MIPRRLRNRRSANAERRRQNERQRFWDANNSPDSYIDLTELHEIAPDEFPDFADTTHRRVIGFTYD